MRDASKQEYTDMYIKLLEFKDRVKEVWADCDLKSLIQTLENIRWYRQFSK